MQKILWIFLFVVCLAPSAHAASNDKTYTNSIGMEFVLIPAGSFSRDGTKFIISKPFYLGKYEVTQEQWAAVMGGNPANFNDRTNPVEGVSWNDAQEFIKRLNAKKGHNRYRLPTEMEWEYAARGGTDTRYFFGDAEGPLGDYAWFDQNSGQTHPVGQKKPNPYGLYDIYGNVWEWVQDWYGALPKDKEIKDYRGPNQGSFRVNRGGGWYYGAEYCRSGYRSGDEPGLRNGFLGFRVALSPE